MCSLCGVLGADGHWSEAEVGRGDTLRRHRIRRLRLTNRVLDRFGLKATEWAGGSYAVSGRTGQTVLVDHLAGLWAAADRLAPRPLDPLDPDFLDRIDPQGGN